MKGVCEIMVTMALTISSITLLVGRAEAQTRQHLVGDDRGWEPSSDIAAWSSNRLFMVGDNIWFAYSAAQDFVSEVSSKGEFESCDATNPIKMYTYGLTKVALEKEGPRYFVSGTPESCKNGLKLQVEVVSQSALDNQKNSTIKDNKPADQVIAQGPTPSTSTDFRGVCGLIWIGFALVYQFGL